MVNYDEIGEGRKYEDIEVPPAVVAKVPTSTSTSKYVESLLMRFMNVTFLT